MKIICLLFVCLFDASYQQAVMSYKQTNQRRGSGQYSGWNALNLSNRR